MHDRALEYALCTRLLRDELTRDGAAALYDTALNNALLEIVARRWPGEELRRRRGQTRSARELLDTIEERGTASTAGVIHLPDVDPPPPGAELMGDPLLPRPTLVQIETLRDAVSVCAIPRHGRPTEPRSLTPEHLEALVALNDDSALRTSFEEDLDEYEERVAVADARERRRARAYFEQLSLAEQEHREAVDYAEEYATVESHEWVNPVDCAVCGLGSLVPHGFDSYGEEVAWGTCAACSYTKSFDVADLEGRDRAIDRAVNDPDR